MGVGFVLSIDGTAASSTMLDAALALEIEENIDQPDALRLRLPLNRTASGDLGYLDDGTFPPFTNLSVVVSGVGAQQCVFDGYVLAGRGRVDRSSMSSTMEVSAQDSSWLMNLKEKVREWADYTDGQVANEIFASYGFSTAAANTEDDSARHLADEHSLMQRSTDLKFLRALARRTGKFCRVYCDGQSGARTGYFGTPALDGDPVNTISLSDPDRWTVDVLDIEWDVMRPTTVTASGLPIASDGSDPYQAQATSSGRALLDSTGLDSYARRANSRVLTATADIHELDQRAAAVLRESGWFLRCRAEVDAARLGWIPRAATVVAINGAGALYSGNWFVWSVHHRLTTSDYRIQFTLARNAIGAASRGVGSWAGGL